MTHPHPATSTRRGRRPTTRKEARQAFVKRGGAQGARKRSGVKIGFNAKTGRRFRAGDPDKGRTAPKLRLPSRSNKGGAVRGRARAAQVGGRSFRGRTLGPESLRGKARGRAALKRASSKGRRPSRSIARTEAANKKLLNRPGSGRRQVRRSVARTESRNRAARSGSLGRSGRTFRRRNR